VTARKLSDLIAEAAAAPYELELPDGSTISVPPVSVAAWDRIGEADSSGDVVRVLAGDHAQQIIDACAGAPAVVLRNLSAEMVKAFGLGN
jgi:hypothetical protein